MNIRLSVDRLKQRESAENDRIRREREKEGEREREREGGRTRWKSDISIRRKSWRGRRAEAREESEKIDESGDEGKLTSDPEREKSERETVARKEELHVDKDVFDCLRVESSNHHGPRWNSNRLVRSGRFDCVGDTANFLLTVDLLDQQMFSRSPRHAGDHVRATLSLCLVQQRVAHMHLVAIKMLDDVTGILFATCEKQDGYLALQDACASD